MIAKQAYKILKRKQPDLNVQSCFMYDNYFVFVAPQGDDDYNDPYYAIDKKNGGLYNLSSGGDLDKFLYSIEHNQITDFR